ATRRSAASPSARVTSAPRSACQIASSAVMREQGRSGPSFRRVPSGKRYGRESCKREDIQVASAARPSVVEGGDRSDLVVMAAAPPHGTPIESVTLAICAQVMRRTDREQLRAEIRGG